MLEPIARQLLHQHKAPPPCWQEWLPFSGIRSWAEDCRLLYNCSPIPKNFLVSLKSKSWQTKNNEKTQLLQARLRLDLVPGITESGTQKPLMTFKVASLIFKAWHCLKLANLKTPKDPCRGLRSSQLEHENRTESQPCDASCIKEIAVVSDLKLNPWFFTQLKWHAIQQWTQSWLDMARLDKLSQTALNLGSQLNKIFRHDKSQDHYHQLAGCFTKACLQASQLCPSLGWLAVRSMNLLVNPLGQFRGPTKLESEPHPMQIQRHRHHLQLHASPMMFAPELVWKHWQVAPCSNLNDWLRPLIFLS